MIRAVWLQELSYVRFDTLQPLWDNICCSNSLCSAFRERMVFQELTGGFLNLTKFVLRDYISLRVIVSFLYHSDSL